MSLDRCWRRIIRIWSLFAFSVCGMAAGQSPFATRVVEYDPAPGQFVNDPLFNEPMRALGAPVAAGISDGNVDSVVTLGGFGGSITLGFDATIENEPSNPFGMDFIVFGNAFWVAGDPQRHFAECAVIEVSRDNNGNGLADDPWYLIRGTHITDVVGQWQTQSWDDDTGDPMFPPSFESWIPSGRSGIWQTSGYLLPADTFAPFAQIVINPSGDPTREGVIGYAEFTPTLFLGDLDADNIVDDPAMAPEDFYTVPDDPFTVGIAAGSGGGDAVDIAWATDPVSGAPVKLTGVDFIRITTGVNAEQGLLGEASAEIDAVADVAPRAVPEGVPTASSWALAVMVLALLTAGTTLLRARQRQRFFGESS